MSRDAAQPARVALLRHLVLAFLGASPSSALFYAERLHALDAQREHACYLLALALERTKRPREAMHVLRQPVAPMSDSPGTSAMGSTMAAAPPATSHANKRRGAQKPATAAAAAQSLFHSSQSQSLASRSPLPACETTVRCARLYASCASQVGASKDALDALMRANVLSQDLSALATSPAPDEPLHTLSEPWALALEFARAARSADNASTAIRAFSSALENNPWCWEALEGLCALGASVDPTQLFPVRPGSKAVPPSISPDILQPTSPQQSTAPPLRAHHPAPLGPSQSSNAAGLGLFTPNVPGAVAFEHVANNKATPTALGKRSITSFTPSVAQPRHNQDKKATWPPPPREAEPSFDERYAATLRVSHTNRADDLVLVESVQLCARVVDPQDPCRLALLVCAAAVLIQPCAGRCVFFTLYASCHGRLCATTGCASSRRKAKQECEEGGGCCRPERQQRRRQP